MINQGAFMEAHDCHYGTPLHVACARQHFDCAKVLLIAGEFVPCTPELGKIKFHSILGSELDLDYTPFKCDILVVTICAFVYYLFQGSNTFFLEVCLVIRIAIQDCF